MIRKIKISDNAVPESLGKGKVYYDLLDICRQMPDGGFIWKKISKRIQAFRVLIKQTDNEAVLKIILEHYLSENNNPPWSHYNSILKAEHRENLKKIKFTWES